MKITAINSNHINKKTQKSSKSRIDSNKNSATANKKEAEIRRLRAVIIGLKAIGAAIASAVIWFVITRGKGHKTKKSRTK